MPVDRGVHSRSVSHQLICRHCGQIRNLNYDTCPCPLSMRAAAQALADDEFYARDRERIRRYEAREIESRRLEKLEKEKQLQTLTERVAALEAELRKQ